MIHDDELRSAFKQKYLQKYFNDYDSRVIDELGLLWGRSRIDLAVVNGHLWGYELKSEADNLDRLEGQLENYNKIFDYLVLVVHEKHLPELEDYLPRMSRWGVVVASGTESQIKLAIHKKPLINKHVNPLSLSYLLWKNEVRRILDENQIYYLESKGKIDLYNLLVKSFTLSQLKTIVRTTLKTREGWRVDQAPCICGD